MSLSQKFAQAGVSIGMSTSIAGVTLFGAGMIAAESIGYRSPEILQTLKPIFQTISNVSGGVALASIAGLALGAAGYGLYHGFKDLGSAVTDSVTPAPPPQASWGRQP